MNLLRGTGRALLGVFFIANGVKAARNPDALVAATEPLADRIVPLAQKTLPTAVSGYVPEDTRTIVRLSGVAGIAGGLGMVTGIAPQAGGMLAAASMVPSIAAASPRGAQDRWAALSDLTAKLALAGAAVVVSQDTRGRPSVFWRAQEQTARLSNQALRAVHSAQSDVNKLSRRAARKAKRAARTAERQLSQAKAEILDAVS